jgi:hypothetical protein
MVRPAFGALVLAGAALLGGTAAHADGQVTFYITVPFGGPSGGHVLGLRLDKGQSLADIRSMNPDSPLNRRPLLDIQMGAHSALRLDLNRRLTWDFDQQQWRPSSRPAQVTLRLPTPEPKAPGADHASHLTPLPDLLQDPAGRALLKSLGIAP